MTSDTQKIQEAIDRGVSLPHQAVSIGMNLYLLLLDSRQDQAELRRLVAQFVESLPVWGMEDLLANQLRYARRLASAPGELLYEEMHKLFSLCDEIRALRELGLAICAKKLEGLDVALRARFSAEPTHSRVVAEDAVEDWNREWWWYADNSKGR